jgi:hypothetical protein
VAFFRPNAIRTSSSHLAQPSRSNGDKSPFWGNAIKEKFSMMKLQVRLTLDVTYSLNGENAQDMVWRLERMCERAIGEGMLTGETAAEVDTVSMDVIVLEDAQAGPAPSPASFASSYLLRVETVNTGGGCMVDLLHMQDGRCVGLNDESIVVYRNAQDFHDNEDDRSVHSIWIASSIPGNDAIKAVESLRSNEPDASACLEENPLTQYRPEVIDFDAEVDEAINQAFAHLQSKMGVTDGGFASAFMSGGNEETIRSILREYVVRELELKSQVE